MRPRTIISLALFFAFLVFPLSPQARAAYINASSPDFHDCEGNACSVVTLTWDQERQQFGVQNDSNQQVKVEVSTFAGLSSVSVLPHKTEYLEVKTFNGPYRANYE